MIELPPMKIYRACLFVDKNGGTDSEKHADAKEAYAHLEPIMLQFVARFDFERDVRPFQLAYRPFNLYLCDIGGADDDEAGRHMASLGRIVRGRSSRVYLFWTGETWEKFCAVNPDLEDYDTCINACRVNWALEVPHYLEIQSKDT